MEQRMDEQRKFKDLQRSVGVRFAAWWNRGAEKSSPVQAQPGKSETVKRDAA